MRVQFSQSSWSHNFFLDFPRTTKPINTTSATMHFHHHRAHTQNHHHMPVRHITLCSRSEFMHSITSVLEMWKSKRRRTASATADKSRRKSKNNQAPAKKRSSRAKRTSNRIEKRPSQVMIENIAESFGVFVDSVPPVRLSSRNKRERDPLFRVTMNPL